MTTAEAPARIELATPLVNPEPPAPKEHHSSSHSPHSTRHRRKRRVEMGPGHWVRLVLLALALLSVMDKSNTAWMAVRTLIFCFLPFIAKPSLEAITLSLATIAYGGLGAFDLSLAILAWDCFAIRITPLTNLGIVVGISGAISLLIAGFVEKWPIAAFPFTNRNHYAVFVEILVPVLVFQARRKKENWLYGAAAFLVAAAVLGGSRTGALLLALEVVALGLYFGGRRIAGQLAVPLALVAALAFLVSDRTRWTDPFQGDHRFEIWSSAAAMVADRPLLGWGAGNFPRFYPAYAKFDNTEFVNAVHSDWLEWTVEYGLVGGMALCTLFAFAMRKSLRSPITWGILVGAMHALVDFPAHLPGFLFAMAGIAGALLHHGQETHQSPDSPG